MSKLLKRQSDIVGANMTHRSLADIKVAVLSVIQSQMDWQKSLDDMFEACGVDTRMTVRGMIQLVRASDSRLDASGFSSKLVLGWVTVFRRAKHLPSHPGQLSLLPSAGREMSTGQTAVMLCGGEVKARYGSLLRPREQWQSIVMNTSVCLCLCVSLSLCLSSSIPPEPHARSLPIFLCMLHMAVARSSSGRVTKSKREGQFSGVVRAIQKH